MTAHEERVSGRPLTIILPAYNEERNIHAALNAARDACARLDQAWEVIVVDDGSQDRSGELVEEFAKSDPRFRLISLSENSGYGAALRAGFREARGGLVFYSDCDLQFDLNELEYFIPLVDSVDAVLGFRVYRYDSVIRCMISWVYNRMVRVLFRVKVRDVDCSFKLFRREVLEAIDLESSDFFIDTELVAKARKWNFRIAEKGVRHYPRVEGESTVHASDIPRTLRTIVEIWLKLHFRRARSGAEFVKATPKLHDPLKFDWEPGATF